MTQKGFHLIVTRQTFTSDTQKSEVILEPCIQIASFDNLIIKSNIISSEGAECPVQRLMSAHSQETYTKPQTTEALEEI